jgi:hypothetical protein
MSVAKGTGMRIDAAQVTVVRTRWTDCVGVTTAFEEDQQVDLLDPQVLDTPPGAWCGLEVVTRGALAVQGTSDAGFGVDVALGLGTLTLGSAAPFFVDSSVLALELGAPGWLDAAALGADAGDVVIGAGSPEAAALAAAAVADAALYADDGDGEVAEDERSAGAVADGGTPIGDGGTGDDDDDDDEEDDDR